MAVTPTVTAVVVITMDGESTRLEGTAMLGRYAMLGLNAMLGRYGVIAASFWWG